MSIPVPSEVLEVFHETLELAEKTASEADNLEAEVSRLKQANAALEAEVARLKAGEPTKAAAAPAIGSNLMASLVDTLQREKIIAADTSYEKAAAFIESHPAFLADMTVRLLTPFSGGGRPIARAKEASTLSDNANLVTFEGRQLLDLEGWSSIFAR